MDVQQIISAIGLQVINHLPVYGGDINKTYHLQTADENFFLKVNDSAACPEMFRKEAEGLSALRKHFSLTVPEVIKHGEAAGKQYLLMNYIEKGSPQKHFWQSFGTALAEMHQKPDACFGWYENNYIGSIVQSNEQTTSWQQFYGEMRILPLVRQLYDRGHFNKTDVLQAEKLCKEAGNLFPEEAPALLHGDLWSGNFCVATNGNAAIYDPAVYYGHREMDLGMTRLFGGFDRAFYEAYNAAYPLEPGWRQRLPLTQLYPLLVHAILFGGHYMHSVRNTLQDFK